jgi:hypothetical protein
MNEPVVAAFELSHSPVRALTQREVDEQLNGGEWRKDVWFLQAGWRLEAERRGFSEGDLAIAAAALGDVYPPDVCRKMLQMPPRYSQLVFGLFRQVPWWERIIGLGLDLAACAGVLRVGIVKRLRDPEEFRGADLEIQVQSNATRSGLSMSVPPGEGIERRADYLVSGLSIALQLEVKSKGTFAGEEMAAAVEGRLSRMASLFGYSPPPDRDWHIEGIGALRTLPMTAAGRKSLDDLEAKLTEEVGELLDGAKAAGWPAGTTEVGRHARLHVAVALGEGGRCSIDLFERVSSPYEASKAAAVVRRYQPQIRGLGKSLPGVFFLDLPWETPLDPVREYVQRDIAANVAAYRFLDGVILRTRGRRRRLDPLWEWHEWFATAWATPHARLSDALVRDLAARTVDSPHRLMSGWLRPSAGRPRGGWPEG